MMPSVLASKSAFAEALGKGDRFLLETDFMDDPTRPGAVLGISTVPKRIKTLLTGEQGLDRRSLGRSPRTILSGSMASR